MKNTELSNYSYTKIENDPRTALSKGTIITDMSSKSLKTGELIKDSYEIIDLIGSGGSALVYKAYKMSQTSIEKEFCLLKEIYPKNYDFDIIRSPKMKNGLKCEHLKIDELISVYINATEEEIEIHNEASTNDEGRRSTYFFKKSSIFTADNNLTYVVLDTVQGETLQYLLENNKVKSLSEICGYMISAVNALEYLHENNVLHLDLSPDNFFVCATTTKEEYDLKIIDYNSARKYVEGKGVSVLHGLSSKQEFEAPEVSIYKPDIYADAVPIDYRADLYSVAAIFYYILFNDSVPRTENTYANEGKIKCKESTYFTTVPFTAQKLTREFLLKGLSIQPWNRYENCEEMREALLQIKAEAEKKIWLLPSAHMEEPQYCVRRDRQIEEIDKILEDKNHIFISGIGGSGKTTLATLYALAKKEKYHTVKMVTCAESAKDEDNGLKTAIANLPFAGLNDNMFAIDSETDITIGKGKDIDLMYNAKMHALNKYTDENTLLIIDNMNAINNNDEECLSDLLEYCQCKIIFTTRINRSDYYFPEKEIDEEEVIELLQNILKDKPDKRDNLEGLKEIIELTDKHYLLTKMIGMLLASSSNNIDFIIEHLKSGNSFNDDEIEIDNNEKGELRRNDTTIENYLLRIFDLSQIEAHTQENSVRSEEMKFILSAMTVVPYSGMDIDKFANALKLKNYNALNKLIRLGWITKQQNIISLHQVISDLLYRAEETKPDWGNLDEFISNEHFLKLFEADDTMLVVEREILLNRATFMTKRMYLKSENAVLLFSRIARIFINGYNHRDAEYICDCIFENGFINFNSTSNMEVITNITYVYTTTRSFEKAEKLLNKAIEAPKDNAYEFSVYTLLATNYLFAEKFDMAEDCCFAAQKVYDENVNIEDRLHISLYCEYLGKVFTWLKKYKQAEEFYLDVLNIRVSELGEFHNDTGRAYCDLAQCYFFMNRYAEAEIFFEKSKEVMIRNYGENSIAVAEINKNLADLYTRSNKVEKSKDLYKTALKIFKNYLGEENSKTIHTYGLLADSYILTGDLEEAERFYLDAIKICESTAELRYPVGAHIYKRYANMLFKTNRLKESEYFYKKSLNTYMEYLGENHSSVAKANFELAYYYYTSGQFEKAEEYHLNAYEIYKKIQIVDFSEVFSNYVSIINLYIKTNRFKDAEEFCEELLNTKEISDYEDVFEIIRVKMTLGRILFESKKHKKAINVLNGIDIKVLESKKDLNFNSSILYNIFAACYSAIGNNRKVEEYYIKAKKEAETMYGKLHPHTMNIYKSLALFYKKIGKSDKAKEYFLKLIK